MHADAANSAGTDLLMRTTPPEAAPAQGALVLVLTSCVAPADFAARYHGDTETVSRRVEGDIHRITYAQVQQRAAQCAHALHALGVATQDRVGTLALNGLSAS